MDPNPDSLWARSTAWRWLVAGASVGTVFILLARPWQTHSGPLLDDTAKFDSTVVDSGGSSGSVPVASAPTSNAGAGDADASLGSGPPPQATTAPVAPEPTGYLPPVRSGVVWSNKTGSVTGNGLIAAYCCAGGSSAVYANTSVRSGRHYWELTLSVGTGKEHPSTATTAGVAAAELAENPYIDYMRSVVRASAVTDGPTVSIHWGEWDRYRTGDVFMFALDADRGVLVYGVNGSWLSGQPGSTGERLSGSPGSPVLAFVGASGTSGQPEGDRWIANFGATAFKYPIPAGYGAYAAGGSAGPSMRQTSTTTRASDPPTAPTTSMSKSFQSQVAVGGQTIPLPDGVWHQLAFFRGQVGSANGDTMILGQIEGDRMARIIAINAFKHSGGTRAGFAQFVACERSDYLFIDKTINEPFGKQQCWWVNHGVNLWGEQPIFRAARAVIDGMHVSVSNFMINVAAHRADDTGFITVFHYFDPAAKGIQSSNASWRDSEWAKTRIDSDPRRVAYVKELHTWGRNWVPVIFAYR